MFGSDQVYFKQYVIVNKSGPFSFLNEGTNFHI